MKKIDLNKKLLDQDDKPVVSAGKEIMLGQLLANFILSDNKDARWFDWALQLHKQEVLEVSETDAKDLEGFIKDNAKMTTLVKGRLIHALIEQQK